MLIGLLSALLIRMLTKRAQIIKTQDKGRVYGH